MEYIYIVRFNLIKENVESNNKKNYESIPISFRVNNVNSKSDALIVAQYSFREFFIGDNDKKFKYKVILENIDKILLEEANKNISSLPGIRVSDFYDEQTNKIYLEEILENNKIKKNKRVKKLKIEDAN